MTTASTRSPSWPAAIEPRVRGWWLVVLALVLAVVYIVGSAWWTWRYENWLMRDGTPVTALIDRGGGIRAAGSRHAPQSQVWLKYKVDGVDYEATGYLGGRTEVIVVKSTVPIRVDPTNPEKWTARTEPAELMKNFVAVWTMVPLIAIALLGGCWAWWRTLSLYRKGTRDTAIVVDARYASLAPASRLVRCTIPATGSDRVVTVYVPKRVAAEPGDELPVIHNGAGRAIAVDWME